ncbi:MAG TPA: PIG-L family deacetylase [Terriglobia bacterium]|nr:PIG-L family deacetylase [Terriglobia bacterium]
MNNFIRHRSGLLSSVAAAALFATILGTVTAQTPPNPIRPSSYSAPLALDRGSAGLWQTLMKLRTRASLLMLTAHPDDEDGGMLVFESRGQGARVVMLTLNRGEGGQNVMSPDYWDALGVLRTNELLATDRYDDVQQYFTPVVDFGFSKTLKEAMSKWGHERVLANAVRVVRMTRPLVVTSVWVGGPSDGHGQHEVAGEMAQEVFKAAGDPNVFPEQIKAGLRPWQPLKMYARVPSFSASAKGMYDYATRRWYPVGVQDYIHGRWLPGVPATNVAIPEGQYNPVLGLCYFQIAAEGLNEQKSQNGGVGLPPPGFRSSPYHRYASRVAAPANESSFFDGIDTSLAGIASLAGGGGADFLKPALAEISGDVGKAIHEFSATQPEEIAPLLADGLKRTDALLQQVESSQIPEDSKYNVAFELRVKQAQFNKALFESLGISMHATVTSYPPPKRNAFGFGAPSTFQVAIPGQSFWVKVRAVNSGGSPVRLNRISLTSPTGEDWTVQALSGQEAQAVTDHPATAYFKVTVPENAAFTQPYFSRPNIEQPYYTLSNKRFQNLPFVPYPLSAEAAMSYRGASVRLNQVVDSVHRVRGEGAVLDPLVVGPAISVWVTPEAGIVPFNTLSASLTVTIHSNVKGPAQGTVRLNLPEGWTSTPAVAKFSTAQDGQNQALDFTVHCTNLQQKPYTVTAVAEYGGRQYQEGYQVVGYTGLRPYNFYRPAVYRTRGVDVKVAKDLRVGYIEGTGDGVPQALESLGFRVRFLSADDLASRNLGGYDAIVLGVRAYAARQDVKTYNARLLDYVKNGGVLIVQYNTPEFDHNYGPYPYSLTRNPQVVVDENSKVAILKPANPALTWPNKITLRDFDGWVEERGHSFMNSWDPRYQALFEMHDPGQPPQKGGLLYARYGKGVYIYDALAFYRQLPEGVPGAYRIFANLLSLAKNPAVDKQK